MFMLRLSKCRSLPKLHSNRLSRLQQLKSSIHPLRTNSTAASASKKAGQRTLYPERLIIYHAGTGRTVFLGCLKVTTIFIFSFFCLVIAPTHFYAEEQPKWIAGAVMLSGIIPMVSVAYISGPFVNYIHLRLPAFARGSREMLLRYSKMLPKDAEIDITTMNFIGKPRVTRMKVADLYPVKQRLGMANYARDTTKINAERLWWMGKAVRQFGVHSGRSKVMGGEIWRNVESVLQKNRAKE